MRKTRSISAGAIGAMAWVFWWIPTAGQAAGTLTPVGSPNQPMKIVDHHVNVTINNGFAKTEVIGVFHNPNSSPDEAFYVCPVPKSASLSEMTITSGEQTIQGEVLPRQKAQALYEEERDRGNQSGLATKESFDHYEFRVAPIIPGVNTTVRYVYYQPLEIDTGVGRYVYPLEDGDTAEQAAQFWLRNEKVEGVFSAHVVLKSAWPVADVRLPGYEKVAKVAASDAYNFDAELSLTDAGLTRDLVVYFRLADDLPGRVEVIPHRSRKDAPGTFMMVVTPGVDLQPITHGADYIFVLDRSGSMQGKIATLARAVAGALGELRGEDRFRIISFESGADELTDGWQPASPDMVQHYATEVAGLSASGGTDMYSGLKLALQGLNADRATSIVLVTDGVTNTGIVDPMQFKKLMERYDVRVFGFLLGNGANWPLMKLVTDSTGGFYSAVSNSDDILGQLLLAKSKITHEAMHHFDIDIAGVDTFDLTDVPHKIYRGQQVVVFGRYKKPGKANLKIKARLTGDDKVYTTNFELPKIATDHPEIERLWAMNQIEKLEFLEDTGQLAGGESQKAIVDLGVAYQLVTDHTAMVVLSDEAFTRHGVERRNRDRVAIESQAQSVRASQPLVNHRVDEKEPLFGRRGGRSHSLGGGAIGVTDIALMVGVLLLGVFVVLRRRGSDAASR